MDKTCRTCKYEHWPAYSGPCDSCYRCGQHGDKDKWEPKEEKMENEKRPEETNQIGQMDLTSWIEGCMRIELDTAREKIREQENDINSLKADLAHKTGMIEGLKYAIRCNGVSGREV